jgi:hypothetical protein
MCRKATPGAHDAPAAAQTRDSSSRCRMIRRGGVRLIVEEVLGPRSAPVWRSRPGLGATPLFARRHGPTLPCHGSAKGNVRPACIQPWSHGHGYDARGSARRGAEHDRPASSAPPCRCAPARQPSPGLPPISAVERIAGPTSSPLSTGSPTSQMPQLRRQIKLARAKNALSTPPQIRLGPLLRAKAAVTQLGSVLLPAGGNFPYDQRCRRWDAGGPSTAQGQRSRKASCRWQLRSPF